jgi:type I restriction enzyme S subunit
LKTILPPVDEQEKIVAYLDRRTAEIDGLLADLQAQAEMLERHKRELIADVVTRGLDKAALRKDSGADWIGEVPSHWEMTTLRAFLKVVSIKNSADLPLLSVEREKGVVDRETEGSENNHNRIPDDLSNYKVVRTGEFVMNKMKAWRGSYGVSRHDGIVSPAYYVFALNFPNPAFFNYAIRSTKYIGFFGRDSYGIRTDQWDFKIERIKDIPFAVPPVEEQQAIVKYLDGKIPLIEGLIADINEQIEKLKQYRQIVIHDAVTGKIKVTEG